MNTGAAVTSTDKEPALWANWYRREPLLARYTLGVLGLLPLLLLALALDERTLNGVNIWVKPIKFNLAIALYLGTLVWFSGWIDRSLLGRGWYRTYTWVLCSTMVFMLCWLYGAALIGEPAHYNRTHPVLAPLYALMGIVSVVFTAGTVMLASLIALNKRSTLTPYFRYSVVCSLMVSFVFTVVLAGELASMDSHWIGGTPSDKHGLWPFGWSRDGGDLRVAHFFSLHAMQFIPVAALLKPPRFLARSPGLTALTLSLLYCSFILFVYFQAKHGLPFLALSSPPLASG